MRTTTEPPIREDFLHYVWRMRQFDLQNLTTTTGQSIEIVDFGEYNQNGGADFLNAKINIDGILWCGSVEMHRTPKDWAAHRHQDNLTYRNVILHVVFDAWEQKMDSATDWGNLPTLVLRDRVPEKLIKRYWQLQNSMQWVACQPILGGVHSLTRSAWLDRLLNERLARRTQDINAALTQNKGSWEDTFWQFLARSFGYNLNADPFEWVARATPNLILAKSRHSLLQIEALLFGQAGFLLGNRFEETYCQDLLKEYEFLKHKFNLSPIPVASWQFARLRPANFPTVRLAQLSSLVYRSSGLFSQILEVENLEILQKILDVDVSEYWQTHYRLDKPSVLKSKKMGADSVALLAINTVAPFLYAYGELRDEDAYRQRAFRLLESMAPEQNSVIENWKLLDFHPQSAAESQGLLELKKHFCDAKRCTECAIGHLILKV